MRQVDIDLNFIFLIMMLAIVLLAAITGFNVGKLSCDKGGMNLIIWQGAFLFLSMLLLALALLFPYLIYWIGHVAIILSGLKIASFVYLYLYHSAVIMGTSMSMLTGEIISTLLLLASGIILVKNTPSL